MALMPVDDAMALTLADVIPLPVEFVPIAHAHGRILAEDLAARRSQPAADMSAMDGYALAGADITTLPATLKVIGESAAGRPFSGRIRRGEATRIFTGALVPDRADTVVIQENTTRTGDLMMVTEPTAHGRHIRKAGFDFSAGQVVLQAGRRLDGAAVMLAAAANHAEVPVRRRPRVGILQTGDELVRPGAASGAPEEVVVSNVYGIAALARAAGAEVEDLGLVGDTMEATRAAVRAAAEGGFDLLVTSGGASVGEHDLMAPALREEGVALAIHKIALRPGKPLMFGRKDAMRVLGLPGNPVSSYVCSILFLVPLLKALQGATPGPLRFAAQLGLDVKPNDGRRDYVRAQSVISDTGARIVTPLPVQDSSMISALAAADCLLIREANAPAAEAGTTCEAISLLA